MLRLARGMTYKCAACGVSYGGGKCVVIGDPRRDKSEAKLRSLARFIHRLNGLFITGVDVGTNLDDMVVMRQETPFVVTLPESWGGSGDTSRETAYGVVQGMRACLHEVYGSSDVRDRMARGAGNAGLRCRITHVVVTWIVKCAAEERHDIMATGTPARGLDVPVAFE